MLDLRWSDDQRRTPIYCRLPEPIQECARSNNARHREPCEELYGSRRPTPVASGFESDKTPESRIREAVLSGFNVTRKPIFEGRVSASRDDQVVPTKELIER